MTPETAYQPRDEQEGTEELHEESVSPDEVRAAILRGENGRLLRGSPKMFFDKLRAKLDGLGIDLDSLDTKTSPDDPPPCFKQTGSDYKEWMRLAAVEVVPLRYDMPGEPNYCNDCTPAFKSQATKAGTCLFPSARFEVKRSDGEKETIGVSRSQRMPPEHCVIYQHMTVPLDALHAKLKKHIKRKASKRVWVRSDFPPDVQAEFEQMNMVRRETVKEVGGVDY